jgi:hypothetical protein
MGGGDKAEADTEAETQPLPASAAKNAIQDGADVARADGKLAISRVAKRFSD